MKTIRSNQTKLRESIVEHGTDFTMFYDEGEWLHAGSKNIDYPMKVSKDHVKSQLPRGKLSCKENGECILDIHINKFYAFKTDPHLLK